MSHNNNNPLLDIQTKEELAFFLGISVKRLHYLANVLENDKKYKKFTISKRHEGTRLIKAPIKPLKDIQRILASHLLEIYKPKPVVHGYVREKSIISNSDIHKKQRWVFKADLQDFFPSIHFGRVRGIFLSPPFSFHENIATVLAQICCDGEALPQGAPTSPILSNLACRTLDRHLSLLAKKCRCFYSRYADDLTFSTFSSKFPAEIGYILLDDGIAIHKAGIELIEIVKGQDFVINDKKAFLRGRNSRQLVTGLVVNDKVNVKREYVREVRAILHCWKHHGIDKATDIFMARDKKNRICDEIDLAKVMRGRVQFIGSVKGLDDQLYLKYAAALSEVDSDFKFDHSKLIIAPQTIINIFTEGKTDLKHLKAALSHFKKSGKYLNLSINFVDSDDESSGDKNLIKRLNILKGSNHQLPQIVIFDADDPNIVSKYSDSDTGYIKHGNNVFSFAIPTPEHRANLEKICIELYYKDETLFCKDEYGRRIYLSKEFNSTTGHHLSEDCYTTYPKSSKLIVDSNVFHKDTQINLSMTKDDFAEYILAASPPFDIVDFSAFNSIFDRIVQICGQSA